MNPIRVAVVDDASIVREGLVSYLDSIDDMHVVGTAATGEALIENIVRWQPDVVIVDMSLSDGIDGVETIKKVCEIVPTAYAIVLSNDMTQSRVHAAVEAGAISYVHKNSALSVLINAIRGASKGKAVADPNLSKLIWEQHINLPALTARETDVIKQLAKGKTNQEIAVLLHVKNETIRTHVASILRKLDVSNRTEAVVYALRHGLIHHDNFD